MALSSIPQFRPVSPEEASPLYAAMKSFLPAYQQAQQRQAQQQQMGLQDQLAQMQMARQKQQMEQSQQQMQKQDVLAQQFANLMGTPGQPAQPSPGDPLRDVPAQPGTGYLGGQIPEDQMRAQYAKMLGASGDYGKAASVMFPRQQEQTAMQRNLSASGFKPGTPEYEQAAQSLLTKGLLPTTVKQARYASSTAKGIIDDVDAENVIDSVSKFSGVTGMGKEIMDKGLALIGKTDPDYQKYYGFIHNTVPALGSEVRRLLGDNASNEQIKQIEKLTNPTSWAGNPELVKSRWEQLKKLHNIATKAISKSPLEISDDGQNVPRGTSNAQNTITHGGQTYTREQLMKIAQGGQ